jgi:hypothetical protein
VCRIVIYRRLVIDPMTRAESARSASDHHRARQPKCASDLAMSPISGLAGDCDRLVGQAGTGIHLGWLEGAPRTARSSRSASRPPRRSTRPRLPAASWFRSGWSLGCPSTTGPPVVGALAAARRAVARIGAGVELRAALEAGRELCWYAPKYDRYS